MNTITLFSPALKLFLSGIANYTVLRSRVREAFVLGQRKTDHARVLTYWEAGGAINRHTLCHAERADYGKKILLRLSEDLKVNVSIFHRIAKFAGCFPIVADGPQSIIIQTTHSEKFDRYLADIFLPARNVKITAGCTRGTGMRRCI